MPSSSFPFLVQVLLNMDFTCPDVFIFFLFSVNMIVFPLPGRLRQDGQSCTPLVNCRSSGLRVSTAAGSTAAMLSAGGVSVPILSRDLQYMVREPISFEASSSLMHGFVKPGQSMGAIWFCKEGMIYTDGSHLCHPIKHGDAIEVSSEAPILRVHLPSHLLP